MDTLKGKSIFWIYQLIQSEDNGHYIFFDQRQLHERVLYCQDYNSFSPYKPNHEFYSNRRLNVSLEKLHQLQLKIKKYHPQKVFNWNVSFLLNHYYTGERVVALGWNLEEHSL